MGESAFQTVPNKLPKHTTTTGKREVGRNEAAEQICYSSLYKESRLISQYVLPYLL